MSEDPVDQVSPRPSPRWVIVCGLVAVLAIQVGYFAGFARDPVFWRDEAATVQLAAEAWGPMWSTFVDDWKTYSHSLALTLWVALFGIGETAARAFSLASCMLATWLLYRGLARDMEDRLLALLGASLFGLSPLLLTFLLGNAAAYAFAMLTCVWAWERMLALRPEAKPSAWLWFGLAALLMLNAQPVNFAFAAALVLVWARRQAPACMAGGFAWWRLALLPGVLAVAALPTLIQAVRFAGAETGCGRIPLSDLSFGYFARIGWAAINNFSHLPAHLLNFVTDDNAGRFLREGLRALPAWIYPVVLALSVVVLWGVGRSAGRGSRWIDAVTLLVVPICVLGIGGLGNDRLVVPFKNYSAFPVGCAALAVMLFARARPALACLVVLVAWRSISALPWFMESGPGRAGDGRDAAAYVASRERPGDVVVLANTALSPAFSYYYHGGARQVHHPYDHAIKYYNIVRMYADQGDAALRGRTISIVEGAARAGQRIWFITGGTPEPLPPHRWYSPDDLPLIRAALARHFEPAGRQTFATTWEPFDVSLWEPRPSATDVTP